MKRAILMSSLLAIAGCGGGNYLTQWAIASTDTTITAGPNGAACDEASATVEQIDFSSDTVVTIYQGANDATDFYLDVGAVGTGSGVTIKGTQTSTGFTFSTTTVNAVETTTGNNNQGYQITTTDKTQITLTTSGSTLTGTEVNTHSVICTDINTPAGGMGACESAMISKPTECDTTSSLHGTQLPNPQLQNSTSIPTQGGPQAQ